MKTHFLRRFKVLFTLVLIAIVTITSSNVNLAHAAKDSDLKVHYFNVGSADSMIVEKKGTDGRNHYMLIDAGRDDDKTDRVKAWMNNHNVTEFDYVIITHYDSDHVKGLGKLLNGVHVKRFLARKYSDTTLSRMNYGKNQYGSKCYDNYIGFENIVNTQVIKGRILKECYHMDHFNSAVDWYSPKEGSMYCFPLYRDRIGEVQLTFQNRSTTFINASNYKSMKPYKEAINDDSLAFHMTYRDSSYVFLGDLKKEGLTYYINNSTVPKNSFLKIPHHGKFSTGSQGTMPEALQKKFKSNVASRCVIAVNSSDADLSQAMKNALSGNPRLTIVDTSGRISGWATNNVCISTSGYYSYQISYE